MIARARAFGVYRLASLIAACALSAQAEYALGAAAGIPSFLPAALPAAVDIGFIAALEHRRFVAALGFIMAALNVASHLLAGESPALSRAVVAAVSVVPVVVILLIEHMAPRDAPATPALVTEPEPTRIRHVVVQPWPQPVAQPERSSPQPAQLPEADPQLVARAAQLDAAAGKPLALRALSAELGIGQRKAQAIRRALATTPTPA